MIDPDLQSAAVRYAELSGIKLDLKTPLGVGTDGVVWVSDKMTAVKVLHRQHDYEIEVECYQRLRSNNIVSIDGFAVPQLLGFDEELRTIEMHIVTPPFVLDFAKCWLDGPADYSEETLADWEQEGIDNFGDARWSQVKSDSMATEANGHLLLRCQASEHPL